MYNLNQFVMIKRNLLGGALLASVLFLFTGCKEIMSHLDNSVDSHLQVADKVTVIGVGDTYTITKDVDYATISDAAPKFESQTPTIATVDPQTGAVKALKSGDARIKISLPDNGLYLDASAIIDIKVRVQNTEQFNANVKALADGDEILFAENAAIELTEPADFSGKKVAIKGVENKPAKITLSKSFVIYDNFTLENVDINASGVTGALLQLASSPTAAFLPKNDGSGNTDYYGIGNITLKNAKITGVKGSLLYDNDKKYCVVALTIDDCQIELATESVNNESIISLYAGGAKDFTVKNSTFVGNNAIAKYFIRFNNNARIDRFGFVKADDTWSFTYTNNTFYKLLKSDGQWGNYNGVSGKAGQLILTVNNNIWYDCDSQTMRRLNQSKNFSAFKAGSTMADNTFWRAGAAVDQGSYGNGSDLATDPNFVNAPTNLKPQGDDQVAKKTGDPRWLK